jgi:hypothetical protein
LVSASTWARPSHCVPVINVPADTALPINASVAGALGGLPA